MNLLTSRMSWLVAPIATFVGLAALIAVWGSLDPADAVRLFDCDGASPVELMTLPLFALVVPLAWLCPPCGGSVRRQCAWSSVWSLLGVMAIVRETDVHKTLFAKIWPDVAANFQGTVYKMRFLKADGVPFMPKLFVFLFFAAFFVAVALPLVRYIVPLFRGFFRLDPVAWTMSCFGLVSVMVLVVDRLPSKLRHLEIDVPESLRALMTVAEEGGEMIMALLALLAMLQAYSLFGHPRALTGDGSI